MLLFLLSCMLTMEVDKERTLFSAENKTFPSCQQKYQTGLETSVRLQFDIEEDISGWGSANYLKMGRYKFILTAAHVVEDGKVFILDGEEKIPARVLYSNTIRDVAILVPERELSVKAKNIKINTEEDIVSDFVNYTGYPSHLGKSTYMGTVASSSDKKAIIQSFALPGSSGSVVFDKKGRVIGVVSAVSISQSPLSPYPELVETIVYIERVGFLNKKFLKEVFMSDQKRRK